jgi:hypothetical protein
VLTQSFSFLEPSLVGFHKVLSKLLETWASSDDGVLLSLLDETVRVSKLIAVTTSKEEIAHVNL